MLDFAMPTNSFHPEKVWTTNSVKDSIGQYAGFARKYKKGLLFSWMRSNNGRYYPYFYDNFEPPVKGWYELTFDAAKMGDFPEDISIMVFTGKYFFADDRPQPQQLAGVISLADKTLKPYTVRVFLNPGENVSVHCYSKHNYKETKRQIGAYIEKLTARGPVYEQWPPKAYDSVFSGLKVSASDRKPVAIKTAAPAASVPADVKPVPSRIAEVSSFNKGMEAVLLQDNDVATFWHTQFQPSVAKPPHYVVLENTGTVDVSGLSYTAWTGGNGNGHVVGYDVYVSDDGKAWGDAVVSGRLTRDRGKPQLIRLAEPTKRRFVRFEVTDSIQLNRKSLASIGELHLVAATEEKPVVAETPAATTSPTVRVAGGEAELRAVIKGFAERAFVSTLSADEVAVYQQVALDHFKSNNDFVAAAKVGIKAVIGSHRFLLAPGAHATPSQGRAAMLARTLWLSVPDERLTKLAAADKLTGSALRAEIERMLADPKSERMVHSFCSQWLNLRGFNKVAPSLKLYPQYNELVNHYLPIETEAYIEHLIRENLPVGHLIDSDFTFLNQRLAQHYGVDGIYGQELRKVSLKPDSPRGGLMTMGSILKVTADGFQTSPILRGAWVSKNIVGTTLAPPPESVEVTEADHHSGKSLKEQIDEHKKNKSCYACHKSIDPYGFALESFDATGQWRTRYATELPHGGTFTYRPKGFFKLTTAVDTSEEINDVAFDDIVGLKKLLLSDHKKLAYNLVKKFFEYTNGYQPSLQQRLDLYAMIPETAGECGVRDLLVSVLKYSSE
jgi:hypothetical protein